MNLKYLSKSAAVWSFIATSVILIGCVGCEPALDSVTSESPISTDELSAKLTDLTNELQSKERELETANDKIKELNSQLEVANLTNEQLQSEMEAIHTLLNESNSKLNSLFDEMKSVSNDISSLIPAETPDNNPTNENLMDEGTSDTPGQ